MKKELYDICENSDNIDEKIGLLFLKNNITVYCEESFQHSHFLKIKAAFAGMKDVSIGFAYTLKSTGKQSYGTLYLEIPKMVQEIYSMPIPVLEKPRVCL